MHNNRIGRQNDLISNAHRTVSETEEVGMEITAELARNREKIESSRAKVCVCVCVAILAVRMVLMFAFVLYILPVLTGCGVLGRH